MAAARPLVPHGETPESIGSPIGAAASAYLAPAIHAGAAALDTSLTLSRRSTAAVRAAAADYTRWLGSGVVAPDWRSLALRVGAQMRSVGGVPGGGALTGFVPLSVQATLLGMAGGIMPSPIDALQRWAGERLGWTSGGPPAAGTACFFCETPTTSASALRCAGRCGRVWHAGCAAFSTAELPEAKTDDAASPTWRCFDCRRSAPAIAARPATSRALPPAPPPGPVGSLERLSATVASLSADRAWEWVGRCVDAAPGPPRRYLPGSAGDSHLTWSRRLAGEAAAVVLRAALEPGAAGAQVLALSFPRIVLRRGTEIPAQIAALAADDLPTAVPAPAARPPRTREALWCERLRRAHADGDRTSLSRLLAEGPADSAFPTADAAQWLDALFPHKAEGEVGGGREAAAWAAAAGPLDPAAPGPVVTAVDVRRWARSRQHKSGGSTGWSGRLVLELVAAVPEVAQLLARLWSLRPVDWLDDRARATAWRTCDGWLLRQPGKAKPRPIAAPQAPRKVASAADARRARPVAAAFCEERGQLGLSRGGALLAYSIAPRLVVLLGGTTCSADNTASFQSFTREGLLDGATSLLASRHAEERPESAAAFARLMSRCVFDAPGLPRTTTVFARLAETRVSHSLAQGCSSSPTAEAVVLAAAPQRPLPVGVIARGAHDDRQTSALPGVDLDAAFALPEPWGGAEFNAAKSVAVGAAAAELVARGHAAHAAKHSSVFGCPVGDVPRWAAETWWPRYARVLANLRLAAAESPDAAILSAHALRGPGGMAAHWLRAAPACAATRAVLRRADDAWVALWLDLAEAPSTHRGEAWTRAVRDRLFGVGSTCLGHLSAEDWADAHYSAGAQAAWPTLAEWAASSGVPWREFASVAGVPPAQWQPGTASPGSVSRWWAAEAARAAEAVAALRASAANRVSARRTGAMPGEVDAPNLWISALGPGGPFGGPLREAGGPVSAAFVVARIFGLPVWPSLGLPSPPVACRHCSVPAIPGMQGEAQGPAAARGPRCGYDEAGEHIGACSKSGPAAGAKWRHDSLVRALADVSRLSGRGGAYHDGPVFDLGARRRPADFMERGGPAAPAGLCVDVTVVGGGVAAARRAEAAKTASYAPQMRLHPHLRFAPFGVASDGSVGVEAHRMLAMWTRSLCALRARDGEPAGSPRDDVEAAVGRAFVRVMIAQADAWVRGPVAGQGRYPPPR